MPFDGSGNFNRVMNWVNDALANIKIVASRHDSEDDNFAAGLSQCITKDGQTQPTANIPMNGKKIINLAAPTNPTDAASKTYVDTADALKAPLASPTFTGKVTMPTGAAAGAGMRLPVVTANPTTPTSGDVWPDITTGAWKYRLTSTTITFAALEIAQTWTAAQTYSAATTMNGLLSIFAGVHSYGSTGQAIGVVAGPAVTATTFYGHAAAGAGNAAFITLDRPGVFAANFGIDTDNKWKVGGFSMGNNAYEIVHMGNLATTLDPTYAKLASPALTGTPTAPTAAVATNTTQLATTAFVQASIGPGNAALGLGAVGTYALLGTNPGANITEGAVVAGSGLRYTHCGGFVGAGTNAPPGSWRAMGPTTNGGGASGASVFLRVS